MSFTQFEDKVAPGLIIAAPASGSGKTLFTLSLLRLLKNAGTNVRSAKSGPDYIDPQFHTLASGGSCINLDSWAMRPSTLSQHVLKLSADADFVICEGVMGLFDGADVTDPKADGSTASLARVTGWPVVLVVDAAKQAASVAALIRGFVTHTKDVNVSAVVFNRVGSPSHEALLRKACATHLPDVSILGALPRNEALTLPERHLGLVQAGELDNIDHFLDKAALWLEDHLDIQHLLNRAQQTRLKDDGTRPAQIAPLGSRIAVAQDQAFAFCYPALLDGWREQGAEILPFSPLAGEGPDRGCDSVYLPGGYPELHAAQLATNGFLPALQKVASSGTALYGECGGFMVLGQGLTDRDGIRHAMAGLLPVETSFQKPRMHLGYRQLELRTDTPFGSRGHKFRGHEFHYASVIETHSDQNLFSVKNAAGQDMGTLGFAHQKVFGSFMHLIDQADA